MCPGGEGAVLKTVGRRRLAGSNPVHGAFWSKTIKSYFFNFISNDLILLKFFYIIYIERLSPSFNREFALYSFARILKRLRGHTANVLDQ